MPSILIDGYNLLHASGVLPPGRGPGSLERAREALLRFLAASLSDDQRSRTTIVFDAAEAPYNLPRVLDHDGMTVRFAPRDRKADDVIEDLILADSAPKRLTVVSSDHRIQRAANRRRARAVDSDVWCAELVRLRAESTEAAAGTAKPEGPYTAGEVAKWLRVFGVTDAVGEEVVKDDALKDDAARERKKELPPEPEQRAPLRVAAKREPDTSELRRPEEAPPDRSGTVYNPFPPGYVEDLDEEHLEGP
ncbi:MAG: NYN domain-containing protein [Planctomycetia bacterium]|nr:NYN domain-containing protein [Planctomycetia bacterium]